MRIIADIIETNTENHKKLYMQNSILDFGLVDFGGYKVQDITKLKYLKVPQEYYKEKYIEKYRVDDGQLIESIAQDYYDNTAMWDFIMLFNSIRSINELPKAFDEVLLKTDARYEKWKDNYTDVYTPLEEKSAKRTEIEDVIQSNNEKFRIINLVKPEYIRKAIDETKYAAKDM